MRTRLLLSFIYLLNISFVSASDYWPTNGWREKQPEQVGLSSVGLNKLSEYVFSDKEGFVSHSLLVIKDGHIVHEEYVDSFSRDTKHLLWSISKSVSSLIFGIAKNEGIISEADFVKKYFPSIAEDKSTMRLKHLLNMSSSIDWRETYEDDPTNSDVVNILYLNGRNNIVEYVLKRPMLAAPGEKYNYSSGDTSLFMGALRQAINDDETFSEYPFKKLLTPLGIKNATLEKDRAGNYYSASNFYLTAQDQAKIGLLMMSKGKWEDKTIVTEDWVNFLITPAPAFISSNLPAGAHVHGAQWWLNTKLANRPKPLPAGPENLIMGRGHNGQKLFIFPSENLILVRNGWDKGSEISENKMVKLLLEAVK